MKALFLGAGASFECGMPLVYEFTRTLIPNILNRLDSKLFDFTKTPHFRKKFEEILLNPNIHYEQMVGALQDIYLERREDSEIAYSVYQQFVECIQMLLLEDQKLTLPLFKEKIKDYIGIKNLVDQQPCLHVFSLNHDINFEEICRYYSVDCKDGFFENSDELYNHIARFKNLTKEQLNSGKFNFFNKNDIGINLIKLHGSLDVFAVDDLNLYMKSSPSKDADFGGNYEEISRVEKHSLEVVKNIGQRGVNELFVLDRNGELQFMRRSLLTGGHKFRGTFDQIAPIDFFKEFKKRINLIKELDVIGYGFGDEHVNDVLSAWIDSDEVKMNIFDPFRKNVPDFLKLNAAKVKIVNGGLTDYFKQFETPIATQSSEERNYFLKTYREILMEKRLSSWVSESESKATS